MVHDAELGRITQKVAEDIFGVVYDPVNFRLDVEATNAKRDAARKARLERGKPFDEFCKEFVQDEPLADVHYYGSWGDVEELTATVFTIDGPERVVAPLAELPPIMIPDRREVKIGQLEARIAELESKYGENVRRLA